MNLHPLNEYLRNSCARRSDLERMLARSGMPLFKYSVRSRAKSSRGGFHSRGKASIAEGRGKRQLIDRDCSPRQAG